MAQYSNQWTSGGDRSIDGCVPSVHAYSFVDIVSVQWKNILGTRNTVMDREWGRTR